MTRSQRRIVHTWIAAGGTVVLLLLFDPWIEANWKWLKFFVLLAIPMASMFEGRSGRDPGAMSRAAERYPNLKVWYAIAGLGILALVIYTTRSDFRIDQAIGFRGVFLIFLALVGPLLFAVEKERFEAAGEEDWDQ